MLRSNNTLYLLFQSCRPLVGRSLVCSAEMLPTERLNQRLDYHLYLFVLLVDALSSLLLLLQHFLKLLPPREQRWGSSAVSSGGTRSFVFFKTFLPVRDITHRLPSGGGRRTADETGGQSWLPFRCVCLCIPYSRCRRAVVSFWALSKLAGISESRSSRGQPDDEPIFLFCELPRAASEDSFCRFFWKCRDDSDFVVACVSAKVRLFL